MAEDGAWTISSVSGHGSRFKYEVVYFHELTDGFIAERVIGEWFNFYDTERPPSSFDGQTPAKTFGATQPMGSGQPTAPD